MELPAVHKIASDNLSLNVLEIKLCSTGQFLCDNNLDNNSVNQEVYNRFLQPNSRCAENVGQIIFLIYSRGPIAVAVSTLASIVSFLGVREESWAHSKQTY